MPNLTIIDSSDALDIEQATPAIARHSVQVYLRVPAAMFPSYSTDMTIV